VKGGFFRDPIVKLLEIDVRGMSIIRKKSHSVRERVEDIYYYFIVY